MSYRRKPGKDREDWLESKRNQLAGRLRLAARIIGFGLVGFGGAMLIGEAVSEFLRGGMAVIAPIPLELIIAIAIGIVALAGLILSWRREKLAGIILVSCAAAMGAHVIGFINRNQMMMWLILGLPYLVSGVLLLNAWRISRTEPSEAL
jgi:hypothetical protein